MYPSIHANDSFAVELYAYLTRYFAHDYFVLGIVGYLGHSLT